MTTACPNPTKSRYATRAAAESAARRVVVRIEAPLSPYECVCTWWHLTKSTPEKPVDPAAAAGATVKELRAAAGEIAVQKLIAAHNAEFDDYLAEEYAALGISLPARIQRYRQERGAA